ncbi:MAG: DUF2023 family protein [Alkalispirochaetaceae bacterium]
MDLVRHLTYEIERGVRSLALYTGSHDELAEIKSLLTSMQLEYIVSEDDGGTYNLYFGRPECIQALRRFSTLKLNEMSEEEDFMVG